MAILLDDLLGRIANRLAQIPAVEAVAIAGSQASGRAQASSDVDIYVYTTSDLSAALRLEVGQAFSASALLNDYWGPGLVWDDPTGIRVDMMFFATTWMQDQVERVLVRHEASIGYSTCFWHTVRVSRLLYDRHSWFAHLLQFAQSPYPAALAKAIIDLNQPLLYDSSESFGKQMLKAAQRGDVVSQNHRLAAWLACYFDILFALNHSPHPGEKRLLDIAESLPRHPANARAEITALLNAGVGGDPAALEIALDRALGGLLTVLA